MRTYDGVVRGSAALGVLLGLGCSRPNPGYQQQSGTLGMDTDEVETMSSSGADSEADDGRPGMGGTTSDEPDDDDGNEPSSDSSGEPPNPVDAALMLYASLDTYETVALPEVGAGGGELSDMLPSLVPTRWGMGLRTATPSQWFAFSQVSDGIDNIDHSSGALALNLRVEFDLPARERHPLWSLAGTLADGGGLRVEVTDSDSGNALLVEYFDIEGQEHSTYYEAGLLPVNEWVFVELVWEADVEPGEANISLWIDGEWIEPLPGYAEGPKVIGPASSQDVILFGSWNTGGGRSAQSTFDEIEIFGPR